MFGQRLLLFTTLILALILSLMLPSKTSAEKCDPYSPLLDNQCDSLRPFPGVTPSPLPNSIPTPSVVMCGNSVTVTNEIKVTPEQSLNCVKDLKNDTATCSYSFSKNVEFEITNLDEAELPIMGNTEDTVNLQSGLSDLLNDPLTASDKMNQYASWYLNGVINRAEYPFIGSDNEIANKAFNFSGPIRKILPQELQNLAQENTVNKAKDIGDQVVACVSILPFGIPVPCLRDFGPFVKGINKFTLLSWSSHFPPKREKFDSYLKYYLAYRTWRGDACLFFQIPLVDISVFLCGDTPLLANYWSNLFPYIPFSSTEDKQGTLNMGGSIPSTVDEAKITNVVVIPGSSNLYFAHMQEVVETTSLLQQTYTAKGETGELISDSVSPKIQPGCEILQTRTNSGDNLYPAPSVPLSSVSFDINFDCTFTLDNLSNYSPNQVCIKKPAVSFSVSVKTPLGNEVFSNTVAGSNSIVRRIFPKIGLNSLLGSFFDIPAAQSVSYDSNNTGALSKTNGFIYFSHIGSVQEYFLKGIQTLIRPKGFGEQVTFAPPGHLYSSCGTSFAQFNPPSSTTGKAKSYFDAYIKPTLTDDVISVYAEAEKQTGLPCEVLAGVHFREGSNDPTRDLQSGGALNGRSLLDSAIQAGEEIMGKMGGKITTWTELAEALSRYNGLGNHNCPPHYPALSYDIPCSGCPAQYLGEDDPYSLAWIDSVHENMYLIYCADHTTCPNLTEFTDPGVLTVATDMYLSKIK
jgi:hypothetical protein